MRPCLKKRNKGDGEMARRLKAHTVLSKDLSPNPDTHVRQLTMLLTVAPGSSEDCSLPENLGTPIETQTCELLFKKIFKAKQQKQKKSYNEFQ